MVVVFASFVLATDPTVKMLAIGMAFAVLIDASLVRMILVPSVMALLDSRAWWMPRWLEPVVPHLQLEEGSAAPASAAEQAAGRPAAEDPDGPPVVTTVTKAAPEPVTEATAHAATGAAAEPAAKTSARAAAKTPAGAATEAAPRREPPPGDPPPDSPASDGSASDGSASDGSASDGSASDGSASDGPAAPVRGAAGQEPGS
jgi:hypothetical protein